MKAFRNVLLVLLVVLMLCALVACGDKKSEGNKDLDEPPVNSEWTLEREEGTNQITFYWKSSTKLTNGDIWIWWDGKDGSGYVLHECEYGYKTTVNIPTNITQVGFIVRKNCSDPGGNVWGTATKDGDSDRFAIITGEETVVYLKNGDSNQYISNDGGVTLETIKSFTLAAMISENKIQYYINPKHKITSLDDIKVYDGDNQLEISSLSSLNNNVVTGVITMAQPLDITKSYEVEIGDYGRKTVMPTRIFDSAEFIEQYTYDGNDLGATIKADATQFKVWAPTASKVVLNLFNDGANGEAFANYEMAREDKGVWTYTATGVGHGTYYTYSVTTAVGEQEAVDPYAKSAGVNGNRGMVVNLDATNPTNFNHDTFVDTIEKYTDAVLWEVHVRDFSNKIAQSQYKGKYLAFTETGLTNSRGVPVGVDYLTNLGITHVHLLPVYDYATVDETNPDGEFNWGYDPKNYNVPEGSYSTNPYDGSVRVNEFKQMVQSMHQQGLGVVMDVVYNHTYDGNSSLNKIVPYYYYRYTSNGANSNGSGCGNETASERYMFSKFMVDSVTHWVSEYHLDGLRFDLMGLHDVETMQKIEQAVHAINPKAIIYGEGWTGGTTTLNVTQQAVQANISHIQASDGAAGGVAVFNDAIRDGLKGSVFDSEGCGYINDGVSADSAGDVRFALLGSNTFATGSGWRVQNAGVINYMSAHDNNTLWDKLAIANADASHEERLAMNRLGAAIVMIAPGTPFMQAGEEMLRTKDGDENSYKSSDAINNIDWEALTPDSDEYAMMNYYKGLIQMRKAFAVFRGNGNVTTSVTQLAKFAFEVTYTQDGTTLAKVIINPNQDTIIRPLTGSWNLVATDTQSGAQTISTVSGQISVGARGIAVLVNA